jgi:hypothetical protein
MNNITNQDCTFEELFFSNVLFIVIIGAKGQINKECNKR